jgi:hypothetical protein
MESTHIREPEAQSIPPVFSGSVLPATLQPTAGSASGKGQTSLLTFFFLKKKGLQGAHTQLRCNGPQPRKGTKDPLQGLKRREQTAQKGENLS